MRVIAGEFRSRVLQAPKGTETRPTSDRLRETVFNVLEAGTLTRGVQGSRFADLFAGSGAVGIEAISRGAAFVWFAESEPAAVRAIKANLAALKVAGGFAIEDRSVGKLLQQMVEKKRSVEIVFLDPPYAAADEYQRTLEFIAGNHKVLLAADAVVIAEHARKQPPKERYGVLQRVRLLEQGDAAVSFYKAVVSG